MNYVKITVITVCYNVMKTIEATIESVLQQSYHNIEYIIKDGKSSDDTMKIILSKYSHCNIKIISEKDNGIYDAMNHAVEYATGDYIIFLNSGDRFNDSQVVEKMADELNKKPVDLLYGNVIYEYANGNSVKRKYNHIYKRNFIYLLGDTICHQSIFARTDLLRKIPFSLEFRICADRDWMLYIKEENRSFQYCDCDVSICTADGYSLQNINLYEKEVENCIRKHFGIAGRLFWKLICRLKSCVMIRKIISVVRGKKKL